MLIGTADLDALVARAPTMASLDPEPMALGHAEILQAAFEMPATAREAVLPAGLHPTNPPLLVVVAWRVEESPWGPFSLAQLRVSCRSGVRPRGLVVGCAVDRAQVVDVLRATWGLPARVADVDFARRYDRVDLVVGSGAGDTALSLVAQDPDPLAIGDVQYTVTMTLAVTPRGPRLVQLEPEYALDRVERVRPRLVAFDSGWWGDPLLMPVHPVAATIAVGSITLPRLRFVCRPDVLAFEGTETVSS